MTGRQFTPPWSVQELEACFIVKDGAGQKLAFVYFEEEPGRRTAATRSVSRSRCAWCCRWTCVNTSRNQNCTPRGTE
jgi:hypothetical protein